jgi:hypothetical protein
MYLRRIHHGKNMDLTMMMNITVNDDTSYDDVGGGGGAGFGTNKAVLYGTICGTIGLWMLGVCYTTKCCQKVSYDHHYTADEQDPVWQQEVILTQAQRQAMLAVVREDNDNELYRNEEPSEEEMSARLQDMERKMQPRTDFLEKALPRRDFDAAKDKGLECTICLTAYCNADSLAGSNRSNADCLHEFHRACISGWLIRKTGCPICRDVLLEQDVQRLENQIKTVDGPSENVVEEGEASNNSRDEESVNLEDPY